MLSLGDIFTTTLPVPRSVPAPKAQDDGTTKKRAAPFSIRLSYSDRARLAVEAAGAPLGAYIKAKILGETMPARYRRSGISVQDRATLAQLVAMLGRSGLFSNLNQLAQPKRPLSLSASERIDPT